MEVLAILINCGFAIAYFYMNNKANRYKNELILAEERIKISKEKIAEQKTQILLITKERDELKKKVDGYKANLSKISSFLSKKD